MLGLGVSSSAVDVQTLEIIRRESSSARDAAPILFVHGGCFGAWCWDEHFLEFFADAGFRCAAVSLRGHGASARTGPLRLIRLSQYVADVCAVIDSFDEPPVLVGHSIGGTIVQRVAQVRPLAGMVLMASNPPTGSWPIARRAMHWYPWSSALAALTGRQLRLFGTPERARRFFFAPDMPGPLVERYVERLQEESSIAVAQTLRTSTRASRGRATPTLVLGGELDVMVTTDMVNATAEFYRATVKTVPGVAHCMMLDPAWRRSAEALLSWLADSPGFDRAAQS